MKVSLALVSHEMVPFGFAHDLASLTAYSALAMPEDIPFGINGISGTYVHSGRQEILQALIAQDVTHILWLDTDMRFPKDSLVRLLQHEVDVVGINYSTRKVPPSFVAIKEVGDEERVGYKLETNPDSTGLEEVDAIGFGMVLMRTECLINMPDPKLHPWFWFEWLPGRQQMIGEDVYFCNLLRKSGVKIHVDHDLSKECKHIGSLEFACEHVHAYNGAGV